MKRISTKIGDVFVVKLNEATKKYFQYVANDASQLNSSVIRAFKKNHGVDESPDLKTIINGEVDFYAHVVLKWGIQRGFWGKIGNIERVDPVDILFRNSRDYGNPKVTVSEQWVIWKINEPFKEVGKLEGADRNAEIGVIFPAELIVDRMATGEYHFFLSKI